jgi:transposase
MLTPEQQSQILALHYGEKKSTRGIARMLGITRDSVRGVIRRRQVNLVVTPGKRGSILDPYKDHVLALMKKDSSIGSPAVLNQIRDLGYLGGISILFEFMKKERGVTERKKEAFLRLDFKPGETAQVDWGEFGDPFGDGVKIHCFAIVLCHSRYMYIEFTKSEKFEDFIRGHEHAFRFFGGVPKECWYDNLASAVTDRMGSLIKFNARFLAYMGHHGIRPHACNPARGNEKGRVEDLIKYIRQNFWAGRDFKDFDDLNRQAILWRNQFANQREHRSTRRVVRLHFESDEKPALMALNPAVYETDEVISRIVPPDYHLIYETNRYSVPWTLVSMPVTVRINHQSLKIYYHEKLVAFHNRHYFKNKTVTKDDHQKGLLERKPGQARETWQLAAVKRIGPKMIEYVDLLKSGHRSLRAELSKILALSTVYGDENVHAACVELLLHGIIGVERLEILLKSNHHPAKEKLNPKPLNFENEKLNRSVPVVDLRRYDALLFESKNKHSAVESEENDGITNDNNSEDDYEF